jgi:uncharacterized membrane protein YdjX (TVP38/TMEM64 family)
MRLPGRHRRQGQPGQPAVLLVTAAAAAVGLLLLAADGGLPDAGAWERHGMEVLAWQRHSPAVFVCGFALLFVLLSALALPSCGALALLAGPSFGTLTGTLLVGLASTVGALLSFLATRHLVRDRVQRRLGQRWQGAEALLATHGPLDLFWLQVAPLLPFAVLNPLLGLSRMPAPAFFWPSLAGLTLGSLPYVWAGQLLQALAHAVPGPAMLALAAAAGLLLATSLVVLRRFSKDTD